MSGATAPCPEAVRSGAARDSNAALSRHNLDFLRFVEQNPEALERQSFAALTTTSGFPRPTRSSPGPRSSRPGSPRRPAR